jgi:hypothetical protein
VTSTDARPATETRWQYLLHSHYFNLAAQTHDPTAGDEQKLAHSRLMRQLIVDDFGGKLPSSMMAADRTVDFPDPLGVGRSRQGVAVDDDGTAVNRDQYGAQKSLGGRLSVFEGRLALNCLRLWSNPGDRVLDPFAGRGSRLAAALQLGRKYVGFDPSPDAVEACRRVGGDRPGWRVYPQSSLYLDQVVPPASADLVFTCPPYWNSEFYGDNGVGVEAIRDYRDFVEEVTACLALAAEALRPDRYLVTVIRGFYVHGCGIDTPGHLSRALSLLGLTLWDQVAKQMSTSRERFHQDVVKWRRTAQTHETVLVFRKSAPKRARDAYRVDCERANTQRPGRDAELAARRTEVLERAGVDRELLRPIVPVWSV